MHAKPSSASTSHPCDPLPYVALAHALPSTQRAYSQAPGMRPWGNALIPCYVAAGAVPEGYLHGAVRAGFPRNCQAAPPAGAGAGLRAAAGG